MPSTNRMMVARSTACPWSGSATHSPRICTREFGGHSMAPSKLVSTVISWLSRLTVARHCRIFSPRNLRTWRQKHTASSRTVLTVPSHRSNLNRRLFSRKTFQFIWKIDCMTIRHWFPTCFLKPWKRWCELFKSRNWADRKYYKLRRSRSPLRNQVRFEKTFIASCLCDLYVELQVNCLFGTALPV